ncbi:MAG: nucleoside triphosphate pyrophosphohydrolase [Pseudomonadales bacterium]|nr:nucleoside triphosphate pyrophosphohydrolase [Pseudomonadales bacterium]
MTLDDLLRIMSMLRDEKHGCAWDRKQSFQTIAPHTLEEAYEVIDAIEKGDYAHLRNELGDLLFQVVFYAQLGKEAGLFDFNDVVAEISHKLLTRHPHVFPDASISSFGRSASLSPEQIEDNWEKIKTRERENKRNQYGTQTNELQKSHLDDIPEAFPALIRARKLQKRAAGIGFDWQEPADVMNKLREEIAELEEAIGTGNADAIGDELGDVLFSCVNLSRHLKQDAESSLRKANEKFERRFRLMESLIKEAGDDISALSADELERYWQRVKTALSQ